MEPFSISCTTCQARLRVRDASAIGQILTCPKCGSMVLIEAPPQPAGGDAGPPSASPTAAAPPSRTTPPAPPPIRPTDSADTVDDPTHYGTSAAEELSSSPDAGSGGGRQVTSDSTPDFAADEFAEPGMFEPEETSAASSGPDELAESAAPPLPDDVWLVAATRQRQRWALAGLALIAGIGLAAFVFAYLAGRGSAEKWAQADPSVAPTPLPHPNTTPAGTSLGGTVPTEPLPPGANPVESAPAVPLPPTAPSSAATEEPISLPPTPAAPAGDVSAETGMTPLLGPDSLPAPAPMPAPGAPGLGDAAALPPDLVPVPAPRPAEQSEIPPPLPTPAVTPSPLAPPAGTEPTVPPDLAPRSADDRKADRIAAGGGLTDTLRRLEGLFDEPLNMSEEEMPAEPATATPVEEPAGEAPPSTGPSKPVPREIDLAARLADPIAEIEFRETPLEEVLQFVTTYSTIPVTLDPDVLVWLNLSPRTPITARLAKTTVEKLLEKVLGDIGLVAVPEDDRLFVTRKPVGEGGLRPAQRQVDDLVGSDPAQATRLVEYIEALIEPDSWASVGGSGTVRVEQGVLHLEQTDRVLIEVSAFLERLRVARGLPKKSKFDVKLFEPVTRTARIAPVLNRPLTLNYSQPTSFTKIVRRLAGDAGVSVLVDWNALAKKGWTPDAETTLLVADQPMHEALAALLEPMELAYRIVNDNLLQITTPAALDGRTELEFYPVGDLVESGKTSDEILTQLRALPGLAPKALQWDPVSRCVLAAAPQPVQQALENQLLEWKTAGK